MFNIVSGGWRGKAFLGDVPSTLAPKSNFSDAKVKRLQRTVARLLKCLQSKFRTKVSRGDSDTLQNSQFGDAVSRYL